MEFAIYKESTEEKKSAISIISWVLCNTVFVLMYLSMCLLQYELYTNQHAFEMKTKSQFPTFLMEMLN